MKNHHPAIIDEELFETVQEIRRANAAKKEKGVKKGQSHSQEGFCVGNAAGFSV